MGLVPKHLCRSQPKSSIYHQKEVYLIPEDNLRTVKLITSQIEASTRGLELENVLVGAVKRPVIDICDVTRARTRVSVGVTSEDERGEVSLHLLCNKDLGRRKGAAARHRITIGGSIGTGFIGRRRSRGSSLCRG